LISTCDIGTHRNCDVDLPASPWLFLKPDDNSEDTTSDDVLTEYELVDEDEEEESDRDEQDGKGERSKISTFSNTKQETVSLVSEVITSEEECKDDCEEECEDDCEEEYKDDCEEECKSESDDGEGDHSDLHWLSVRKKRKSPVSSISSKRSKPMTTSTIPQTLQSCVPADMMCFCGRGPFQTLGGYRAHTKLHGIGRPFRCDVCDKRFKRKQDLNRHENVHLDRKPFECDHCLAWFSRRDSLMRHVKLNKC
jgi:hypothetical protein